MNWLQTRLLAIFLTATSLLVPLLASAIPVTDYVAADSAKQRQMYHDAFSTALALTVTSLRSTHFSDGREKKPERIERDRARANEVEVVAKNINRDQTMALNDAFYQYAKVKPTTQMEDIITSFLLTQADERLARANR